MKSIYFLLPILFTICIFSNSFSQVDNIPPVIEIDPQALADSFSDPGGIPEIAFFDDSVSVSVSCKFYFPTDYFSKIPKPTITDETDPEPEVNIFDIIVDTLKQEVMRKWVVIDASGNVAEYILFVYWSGSAYTLIFNGITINNTIFIPENGQNGTERDSIYFCNNPVLNFRIEYSWGCARYQKIFNWDVNDKPAYSVDDPPLFSLLLDTLPATFNVVLRAFNSEAKVDFSILHLPKAQFVAVNPTCAGSSNGSISVSGPESIRWEDNSTNLLREGLAPGKYWFTYGNDSCSITDTVSLVPEKGLTFAISPDTVKLDQQNYITVSNTSSLEGTYIWSVGDSVFVNNNRDFQFFLRKAGIYPIELSVGGVGCTDMYADTFIVSGELPTISFEVTNPSCIGSADGSIYISGATTLLWEDQSVSPLRQNLDFGTYVVSYSNSTGSYTDTIKLEQQYYLDFNLSDDQVDLGEKTHIDISNTSTLGGFYQWLIGDSTFINNDREFRYDLREAGSLDISLTLANSNCLDKVEKTVVVTGQIPTGLPRDLAGKFEISPVPVHDQLQVKITADGIFTARIFDLKGVEVNHIPAISSGKSIITVGDIPAGTYIIRIFRENEVVYNQKFIKLK